MSEKRRTQLISLFLVVAVIWAGFNYKSEKFIQNIETPQTVQPLKADIYRSQSEHSFLDIKKYEAASWGKSPFQMATLSTMNKSTQTVSQPKTLSWILSGILFNKNSPTAIINKRPVKIGQKIDKAIVTEIDKDKVIIQHNNNEITLTVSKG